MKENIHIEVDFMWLSLALIIIALIITSSDRAINIKVTHESVIKATTKSNSLYNE